MLQIQHKGTHYNAPLDQTQLTGNVQADAASAYIAGLIAGRMVKLTANGIALADGTALDLNLGFIINDAAGYFFENKPALASGLLPVSMGNQVVVTDQIVSTDTFSPGDALYIGTGSNKGLVTKVKPTGGTPFGIAGSSASAAAPQLTVIIAA